MKITSFTLGDLDTNCYLATCPETQKTVIIDPAAEGDFLSDHIVQNALVPTAILLTHAHYDHVLGLLALKLNFDIPIMLHPADTFLLEKAESTARHFGSITDPIPAADAELEDGQIINFGNCSLQVIHTPGHTPGSVCFASVEDVDEPILFSGDTLFKDAVGSTQHSYSSAKQLKQSLRKLCQLPAATLVYSGHGELTSIGSEAVRYPSL